MSLSVPTCQRRFSTYADFYWTTLPRTYHQVFLKCILHVWESGIVYKASMGLQLFGKLCAVRHRSDTETGRGRDDKVREKDKSREKVELLAPQRKLHCCWAQEKGRWLGGGDASERHILGFLNKHFDYWTLWIHTRWTKSFNLNEQTQPTTLTVTQTNSYTSGGWYEAGKPSLGKGNRPQQLEPNCDQAGLFQQLWSQIYGLSGDRVWLSVEQV